MAGQIDRAFRVDALSLGDAVGIFFGDDDPTVVGVVAPLGSLYLRTNGQLYLKTDTTDTDWTISTASTVDTRTDVSDDGVLIVSDATDINFRTGFTVTDDSDGSVTVDVEPPFNRAVVNSATYTIQTTDDVVGVQYTTTGPVTLTLPDSTNLTAGHKLTIKDEGGKAKINRITVERSGSDTIDGDTDFIIAINRAGVQLRWTGFEWSLV